MIGTIAGLFGRSAKRGQARQARMIGDYNAKVAEIQSQAEQASIDFQSRRLVKQQREIKAQQIRMGAKAQSDALKAQGTQALIQGISSDITRFA